MSFIPHGAVFGAHTRSRFSIDLVAETDDGESVIIENQLEKTDHKHLGQIITYLTNFETDIAIWITSEPRVEHINAVNWLNENSENGFYLVKLDAYRIENSKPAPLFTVICQPEQELKQLGDNKKNIQRERHVRKLRRASSDTIVVPARKEGFERVFLGENCWYEIRIGKARIEQLKYIAAYQVDPIRAVTHIAEIKEIEPYKDSGKYIVKFKGKAKELKPIPLGPDTRKAPQCPIYVSKEKLLNADSLSAVLSSNEYLEKRAA